MTAARYAGEGCSRVMVLADIILKDSYFLQI
jgi:hypothetical protein